MILDILIVGIMVASMLWGRRSGCVCSLIRLCAISAGIVAGASLAGPLSNALEYTPIEPYLMEHFTALVTSGSVDLAGLLPDFIAKSIEEMILNTQSELVQAFVNVTMTILAFLVIVIVTWVIAISLMHMAKESKRTKGMLGSIDSLLGLFFGALRGGIIIMLLLAGIMPICGIFAPDQLQYIGELLDSSLIAGWLYDVNPLISFVSRLV